MFFQDLSITYMIYLALTLAIAFSVHEFAHAYSAYRFGDNTAARQGRLTLNPLKHLDPIGTILFFIVGFGWARPVPVNRFNFKNPRVAGIIVSVLGPISNLLLAVIGAFLYYLFFYLDLTSDFFYTFSEFLLVFISINVLLFVFNLIPLPPLDGYRIVEDLLPQQIRPTLAKLEPYGAIIFLVLVLIDPLYNVTIGVLLGDWVPAISGAIHQFFFELFITR
ncbi:MAG TPA: site-2 protease family protein [Bacillus sp. (in: firmicutes)]|nr:site-2 protease family protein [Bacillus litorisediminis]HWO76998.1 site-2 protease family protein [Bacillus sp. (in: firmicutes)]